MEILFEFNKAPRHCDFDMCMYTNNWDVVGGAKFSYQYNVLVHV